MRPFFLSLLLAASACAENIVFPADAACNITQPPYSAKGDGIADDTAAIQKALDAREKLIYLPDGTYRITATLRWGKTQKRQVLQGQSLARTILKLDDRCPGFSIPERPLAMLWTGTAPAQRVRNGIRNLTLDTGTGNPGAIGAQFIANNQGTIDTVRIRCGDTGPIGLDLGYTSAQGPCLITNIEIAGFDIGIFTKGGVNSITAEHIRLGGQKVAGWKNEGQSIFIRDLQSTGAAPALLNTAHDSLAVLLDSKLEGAGGDTPAIVNADKCALFLRNLTAGTCKRPIQNDGGHKQSPGATALQEWASHPITKAWDNSPDRTLGLPIKETPEVEWDDPRDWISVTSFPPKKIEHISDSGRKTMVNDWTDAIQSAIDSGKPTVYFPKDGIEFTGTLHVRGKARRFIGCERAFGKGRNGTWIIEDGDSPTVLFERFDWEFSPQLIRHTSLRTLVVRNITGGDWHIERGAGDAFLSDLSTGTLRIDGAHVWARQLNTEGSGDTKVINDGGTLWILGLKTEGDSTLVESRGGARTEIAGAFVHASSGKPKQPCFIVTDSAFSVSMAEAATRRAPFQQLVVETRLGQTRELKYGQAPTRAGGSLLTLFSGAPPN